ncbi:DUF4307 domain-containing protein [Actinoplanes sp. RD1]|uniref:DUF4307 domain-containing protein n=1 Tax=Actinoplanes sp. RD1 TaxID=3064538 RepID=UPI002741F983|nr:DUF4307 domain-containing protein [Actinoplanes sp. RD1]
MSETRATAPVFPPGRYGRRRDGRRRLLGPIVFALVIATAVGALSVRLYGQYGDPNYDAQIIGWGDVTDTSMTIRFSVRVPAGGSAMCGLRARDYDGYEVGRRTVTVSAKGDDTTIEAAETVTTTARASVGDVIRCDAPR